MKIRTHSSLLVAQAVVAHLQTLLEYPPHTSKLTDQQWDEVDLSIGSFQNCREQGLTISAYGVPYEAENSWSSTCYFIAEHRSSDVIVVYVYHDVINASDDGIYNDMHTFGYGQYNDAARFIVQDIAQRLEKSIAHEARQETQQQAKDAQDDEIRDLMR